MATLSGQITVATAGTAVAGPSGVSGEFILVAHPGNTGNVYVGNDGSDDVDANNSVVLAAGDKLPIRIRDNEGGLSSVYFDAATNGDKVCWLLYD